jgi:hypothetical protein
MTKDKRRQWTLNQVGSSNRPRGVADNKTIAGQSDVQDLNFKVSPNLHRAFKVIAAERGMPMKDLLNSALRCWIEIYGNERDKTRLPPI